MTDDQHDHVSREFASEDEAIRAIQGLKAAGFDPDHIRVGAADPEAARKVADVTGADVDDDLALDGPFRVVVDAGPHGEIAGRVMIDGIVDTLGVGVAPDDSVYLDPSTGSTAGVASSTGTATGIAPGAGYEGNTGSTAATTPGALGQLAPGADTPAPDDDFPGRKRGD